MSTRDKLALCQQELKNKLGELNQNGNNHIAVAREAQHLFLQESVLLSELATENSPFTTICL